jgi:hypothetical protein
MNHRWRNRFLVVFAAAVAALVAGLAYATIPTTGNGTGSASTGALTLTANGAPATSACAYTALALGIVIETQRSAASGSHPLYDTTSTGLTMSITSASPSVTYRVPTAPTPCPAGAPALSTCYELDHELVSTTPFTSPSPATSTVTFTLTPNFPTTAGNAYQASAAQVLLTVQAVQAAGNTISCSSTAPSVAPPTAGAPCTPAGTFTWS